MHFSTADIEGGSARSAYRIHDGLRRLGHRSRMLVGVKRSGDADVASVTAGPWGRRLDAVCDRVTRRLGLQYQLVPSSMRVRRHPWLASADVVQLYNLHGGWFNPRLLPVLSKQAPLVWRLSDMWPVTGHCAYSGACERWRNGCGRCPDLATYPAVGADLTAFLWRIKQRTYRRCRLTVVAPSSWTETIARQSPLFTGCAVHRIPNGLDRSVFRPLGRAAARELLGVDAGCTAMLFSSQVAWDNPRKGTHLLLEALRALGDHPGLCLLVAGEGADRWRGEVPQQVVALGNLADDRLIAAANAAADLVVVPSATDNLPNTVVEAMACARPAVAFDTGGLRDAVRDGETGLLVPAADTGAFAMALRTLIEAPALRERFGAAALELAEREFCSEVQARRFETLYADILRDKQ